MNNFLFAKDCKEKDSKAKDAAVVGTTAPLAHHSGEILLSIAGILITLLAVAMVGYETCTVLLTQLAAARWGAAAGQLLFLLILAILVWGALIYLFTRLGYYRRLSAHVPASAEELVAFREQPAPELTILVPAYMEEPGTVMQTLLSAALQDYPNRRVVLLIDDPPVAESREDRERLARTRALPKLLQSELAPVARRMNDALLDFDARVANSSLDSTVELETLANLYVDAATWFAERCIQHYKPDHVSQFFCTHTLYQRQTDMVERELELRGLQYEPHAALTTAFFRHEYRRLATLFDVEISSFERKLYANLSHEPNKAMNLNAYIGLLGGSYRETGQGVHTHLEAVPAAQADLHIADTDYLLTLDADSILLPDYAARLVQVAEQSGNERLAVVQTPYSAFPDAPGLLERIAGATTDIQYIVHQGFTASSATYWVGANALLRKAALLDIATEQTERGYPVPVFIQDRTVIEDTESTVDLIARGWQLHNYPERLAYSATPPDFGSLLIQRRRWANGGLIILPKLLRYLWRKRSTRRIAGEAVQRIHYLLSIAAVNTGMLILMAFPLMEGRPSLWMPLLAVPYFILLARDLKHCGYRSLDLFRFYAFTLILLPVNLGGVCKSLQQSWTGRKTPFGRTPKVEQRTATPFIYILMLYALPVHWCLQVQADLLAERWFHAFFVAFNTTLMLYGLLAFIGVRASCSDVVKPLLDRITNSPVITNLNPLLPKSAERLD